MIRTTTRTVLWALFKCFRLCRSYSEFDVDSLSAEFDDHQEKIRLLGQFPITRFVTTSKETEGNSPPAIPVHLRAGFVSGITHPGLFERPWKQMEKDQLVVPARPTLLKM